MLSNYLFIFWIEGELLLDTRILKYFLTIARVGTISEAARELHVTQPTLSRQLKDLEKEIGTDLFIRKQRQMVLTEAGLEYQLDARQIIALVDHAKQKAQQAEQNIVGTITIGCIESNAAELVAKTVKEYHQKYPAVKFEIYDLDSTDIQERIDQGLLDAGIILKPSETVKYSSYDLNLIDKWGIVVSKSIKSLNSNQLKRLPLILTRNNLIQSEINSLLNISVDELNILGHQNLVSNSFYMAQNDTAYPLCAKGAFIQETKDLRFLEIKGSKPIQHQIIWSKQRKVTEIVLGFIKLMTSIDEKNKVVLAVKTRKVDK